MKDSVLSANKDYEVRVSNSIANQGDLEYWWNFAIGIKLKADGIEESGDKDYWRKTLDFPNKDVYIKNLKELLTTRGGDAFRKITVTKKGEGASCRIALSNFTFTLLIRAWSNGSFDAEMFFNNSYNSIELCVSKSLEDFVAWILRKNEEMIDFRKEWEEHCLEMKKRIMSAKLECQALEIALNDRLKDTDTKVKLVSCFKEDGAYVQIRCSNPYLEFYVPNYYQGLDKIIDIVEDIIRNKPKEEN